MILQSGTSRLFGRSVVSLIGDDGLQQVDNLLLPSGHDVELSAYLRETVVDMGTEVDEVLPKGVETCGGGTTELTKFATELTDIAVGSSGENTSGGHVLLTCPHTPREVAHLLFESADT